MVSNDKSEVTSLFAEIWSAFDLGHGLTEDLLPVPQPDVPPSPRSHVTQPGKVPGRINAQGQASGFPKWTSHKTTGDEITRWSRDPRLGVCLQTRNARAIDIDVDDPAKAQKIEDFVREFLGLELPCRTRGNSGKRALLVCAPGEFPKRIVKLADGMVEFLGTGQQIVIAGQHPSGAFYSWRGGLPGHISEISVERLSELVEALAEHFGAERVLGNAQGTLRQRGPAIEGLDDPVAEWLLNEGHVLGFGSSGELQVECPWKDEHSSDSGPTESVWYPAGTNGYEKGAYKCLHAHCEERRAHDFEIASGFVASEFDALVSNDNETSGGGARQSRFRAIPAGDFMSGPQPKWLVKGVLPQAALCMIFGPSGAGKSFFALDVVAAVALGVPWRDRRVKQANVLYVCAEGAGGFRNRVRAYRDQHQVEFGDALQVIPAAPSLLKDDDTSVVVAELRRIGAGLVVIDTLAQATPGGDENSAADMGKALERCRRIHEATGATVLLIHHAGKDHNKGARGWSGIRAAADAEIEVVRQGDVRLARITKMKDGQEGEEYGFALQPVPIGLDEDGDPIESCVVEAAEVQKKRSQPTAGAKIVHEQFCELTGLGGESVTEQALLSAAVQAMPPAAEGDRDRRRDKARRGLAWLYDKGWLVVVGGVVAEAG